MKRKNRFLSRFSWFCLLMLATSCLILHAQTTKQEIERQKQAAEQDVRETKAELNANERKVNAGLASLRKLDGEISVSQKEIETVRGQIEIINGNISSLESSIATEEAELKQLREEYLKAVKKMRVARKQNSGMVFLFSAGSFNEARRRMRYVKEFSDWKERRSSEIKGKVASLQQQKDQLAQVRNDATVALHREQAAQEKLSQQRKDQQAAVTELRANSDALRAKLAKRQAEARKLSNQISQLITEERAKEAEARRKAEEKRLAGERRVVEEKRKAEEKRLAEEKAAAEKKAAEKKAAEEKKLAQEKSGKETEKSGSTSSSSSSSPSSSHEKEYAEARKRKRTTPTETQEAAATPAKTTTEAVPALGFESMKGKLPKPVGGSFKIISAFGIHPISPELPDIMDENLGIDAHVANGASATAVYEGEVIKIYDRTNTPGFRNIVVLKHGDYITVYANLETLAVHSGQKVSQGQSLGTVGSDFDDPAHGLIHFEVWKNQTHLNPAAWIRN